MTFGSTHDPVTAPRPSRRSLSPLLTIRAVQVVLWLLVVSGPVVGLIVASRLASIGDRLDRLAATATVEAPPDTSGVEARYPKAKIGDFDGNPAVLTEMDALVAYLQMLGTLVDFSTYDDASGYR